MAPQVHTLTIFRKKYFSLAIFLPDEVDIIIFPLHTVEQRTLMHVRTRMSVERHKVNVCTCGAILENL